MKIVVLDGYTANPGDLSWDAFRELGDLTIYDRTPASETVARAADADVALTNKVVFDAETLAALPNLRYVGVLATGFNVVDLKKAREQGVVVTNVPTYSAESVVQSTFAHLLNLASSLAVNAAAVRDGAWSTAPDFTFTRAPLTELFGKRLGIVGFGTIGRRVAEVARAFGLDVVAFGPRLTVGSEPAPGVRAVSLDELFATSDAISLHCPLTPSTKNLVDAERLSRVKTGAWLINTGRGPLLDEAAVAAALASGKLGGVGVDVLSTEPPAPDNPLIGAPNCFISPHTAWATLEARTRLLAVAAENLRAFAAGRPVNVVN
ncbi:MAG: D-2-hydroxyacid dehydrogenase [Thermoguttaceae bacterium]|nr:D-2-hydroxyacid dehydrogenase [Thermoguttaceae bacterium]